jgi:hypothetical protein
MAAPFQYLATNTGAVLLIFREAGECGRCGAARFNFINRNGITLCLICDLDVRAGAER